jgi:bacteriocin-like protein
MSKSNKKQQPSKKQQPTTSPTPAPVIELTDDALEQVTGGLNPQPLPPRGDPKTAIFMR